MGLETKNSCAGEGQQQFAKPKGKYVISCSQNLLFYFSVRLMVALLASNCHSTDKSVRVWIEEFSMNSVNYFFYY
jgi:hypothetical protein